MQDILQALRAKRNELESMKDYITDETSLNIIKAKQDTIDDLYKMVDNKWTAQILNACD
jgi:hypothetical protein